MSLLNAWIQAIGLQFHSFKYLTDSWFPAADLKKSQAWPHQDLPWQNKCLLSWKQKVFS